MANSTAIMPCNSNGIIPPAELANYSLVSIDWSNGKNQWVVQRPMTCEEMLKVGLKESRFTLS